jgi:type I restriction enzyme S subunit
VSRRSYPRCKPSGVEWLGEIPEHWDIRKLKHISSVHFSNVDKHTVEGERRVRLCNYVDVYYNSFITVDLNFMEATAPLAQIAKFALRRGDVIVTKDSEAWDDIAIPAYVSSDMHDVLCGYHLAQIRPDPKWADGNYLFRAFCSRGINDQFRVAATGITRYGLGKYWLDNGLFLVPPVEEHLSIAAFLDRETARLDALMEKKQRQIELLQEKRAALISHAVTKGLDPSAPMKDSGVEWLGQIPAHWRLSKQKHIASSIQTGPFGSQLHAEEYVEDSIPAINPSNLQNGSIVPDWRCCVEEATFARSSRHRLDEGDIVFARRAEMGRCALVTRKENGWLCGTGSIRIRLNKKNAYPPFVYQVLSTPGVRDWLFLESVGSTMENLKTEIMSRIPIPLPPLDEQAYIVRKIEKHLKQIDKLKTKIQESIDRLKEYRTALISAAVTGKIDVREAAA